MQDQLGGSKVEPVTVCHGTIGQGMTVDQHRLGGDEFADRRAAGVAGNQAKDRREVHPWQPKVATGHAADQKSQIGYVVDDRTSRAMAQPSPVATSSITRNDGP